MKTLKSKPSTSRIKAREKGPINIIVCLELMLFKDECYAVQQMGFYNSENKQQEDIFFNLTHLGLKNRHHVVENGGGICLIREDGSKLSAIGNKITKKLNHFFTNISSSASGKTPVNLMFYSRVEMEYFGQMYSSRILEHDNLIFSCFQDFIEVKGYEFKPLDKHLNLSEPLYSAKKQCLILKEKLLPEYETKQCLFTSHKFPFPSSTIQDIKVEKGFSLTISCCQIQTDQSAWIPLSVSQENTVSFLISITVNVFFSNNKTLMFMFVQ